MQKGLMGVNLLSALGKTFTRLRIVQWMAMPFDRGAVYRSQETWYYSVSVTSSNWSNRPQCCDFSEMDNTPYFKEHPFISRLCVQMLLGERVVTASHNGIVKMWDVRTDTSTDGRCSSAILCMEYDDSTRILAVAGRDTGPNIWDIRAGKQMHKLQGHTKWIRF